jgi:hypothetical protein
MQYGISYEEHLARIAPNPWTTCDLCEERVLKEDTVRDEADNDICPECSALTQEERDAVFARWKERHIAKMRARGITSLFEAIAPRRSDFGGGA